MNSKPKTYKKGSKFSLLGYFLKGSKRFFIIGILCAGLAALADMISPQIVKIAIDNIIGKKDIADLAPYYREAIERLGGAEYLAGRLWIVALCVVAVQLIKAASQFCFRVSNSAASEKLIRTMRDSLYSHIARLPFDWHMKHATGDIIQRCTSDIDTVRRFVSDQLTSIFRIALMLVLSVIFMLRMNVPLTLIAVIPMPVIILYSVAFHSKIGKGFKNCDENEGKLSAMAQENLTGIRVVRAFGREKYETEKFEKHNDYYTGLWVHLAKVMSRFWATSDILSGLQALLIVVFGAVFCVKGRMSAGEYVAFITYNSMLAWPIRQLGRMLSEMSKAGVSINRLQDIMDADEEKDEADGLEVSLAGDIAVNGVTFSYDGSARVLDDVTFDIKSGSTLGILGGTGSGKSTLMLLLDRLYDVEEGKGSITVGGVDIRKIRLSHLRKNVGIVLQEPFLFSRSLAENIGIAREDMTMEDIRKAADAACLDETVMGFAKGYDTFVGERGVTLSGGQKQRAAIARALTLDAPIMIFDDSLSAVDTETDAKIRGALEARFGKSTTILISHRITTLSKADKIIVLDKGRVVECGTHDELKGAGGIYSKIYEIQSYSGSEVQEEI